jgi:L-threonylcarbamoyladenylate synthase
VEIVRVDGRAPDPDVVGRAVALLLRGALLVYPTDTLYALGGRALDAAVVERLRAVKRREQGKPLPLVAADPDQARELCRAWPALAQALAERFWPGPLTLVLPAAAGLPAGVTAGGDSVAVRVPGLALTRVLCASAGPLVSTSANPSGGPPARTCQEAAATLGAAAALALDAGPGQDAPSTIVDVSAAAPRLLRAGAVPWDAVQAVWRALGAC